MFFKQIVHEDLGCASYMVCSSESGRCAVIDPRWEIEPYLEIAQQHGYRITDIVETHTHADHVSGHGRLAQATGATISIHKDAGVEYPHRPLEHNDVVDLGDVKLLALHTPGHRPEHIAVAVIDTSRGDEPWMVLTGDSLFVGDVARPDLAVDGKEGAAALHSTLHDVLLRLPDHVQVFPGHVSGSLCGRVTSSVNATTIGYERQFNDALHIGDQDDFVRFMNEGLPQRPPNLASIVEANRGPLVCSAPAPQYLGADKVAGLVEEGAVLLDVRATENFLAEHIPASLHVALSGKQFGTRVGFTVPSEVPIVLVTEGEEQARQAVDALRVVAYFDISGYTSVSVWKSSGRQIASINSISPETLYEHLTSFDSSVQVLDVREASEWAEGHIEGALFIPYHQLRDQLHEIPTDADLAIICDAAHRSAIAAALLAHAGLRNVTNVAQGMSGWRRASLPTTTDEPLALGKSEVSV